MTGTGAERGEGSTDPVSAPGVGPAPAAAPAPLSEPALTPGAASDLTPTAAAWTTEEPPTPTYGPPPYAPPPGLQPPTVVSPLGQQPPVGWPIAPSPTRRDNSAVIVAATLAVVLLVACLGVAGRLLLVNSTKTAASSPASEAPLFPTRDHSPTASAEPNESELAVQQGPQPSAYPATEISDLNRVCDENVYYPESPKRAGRAPHPVVLLIGDGSGLRYQNGTYYFDEGLSKRVEQTWASEDPKKVQMVACLDRVSTGSTIRRCKYDDPKPITLTLLRAGWRLRVYEVATGRKLLDKAMAGDDQACPYVVLASADKKIYATVSNKAAVAALRRLVNR
ncbi:hypothetical protein [Micromonospora globispora]|uniref:hypothetical protein n=1 Tax=Micromonospora globispora TaxID=1450148 RepID=UPI000F515CA1|nr:hypothetical protein [Micromonospora globispora]